MEHQWSQLSDPVGLSTKSHAGEACETSCTYKNQRQLKFLSLELNCTLKFCSGKLHMVSVPPEKELPSTHLC